MQACYFIRADKRNGSHNDKVEYDFLIGDIIQPPRDFGIRNIQELREFYWRQIKNKAQGWSIEKLASFYGKKLGYYARYGSLRKENRDLFRAMIQWAHNKAKESQ